VWDALGVRETIEKIKSEEKRLPGQSGEVASWVHEMLDGGNEHFYKVIDGVKNFYDIASKSYQPIPGAEDLIVLDNIRDKQTIWKNSGVTITDLGDGIINCEFHTKMNTIGGDVIQGVNKAIDLAEQEYRGLVITNEGKNFSAGANIGMIFMMAVEQDYDELNMAVRMFQNTAMRLRYSSIP
ncbi:hypothetical protein M8994_22525, partial [Brucella sp. 21LCYQ03]|nr:hypothetical protein [Brucella sp. 21LCYQ03]